MGDPISGEQYERIRIARIGGRVSAAQSGKSFISGAKHISATNSVTASGIFALFD